MKQRQRDKPKKNASRQQKRRIKEKLKNIQTDLQDDI